MLAGAVSESALLKVDTWRTFENGFSNRQSLRTTVMKDLPWFFVYWFHKWFIGSWLMIDNTFINNYRVFH